MVLHDFFIFIQIEVNMNDIGFSITLPDIIQERLHQLGLSAAPNAGDYLDVRRSYHILQFVQIKITFNQPHETSPHCQYIISVSQYQQKIKNAKYFHGYGYKSRFLRHP
jgi:hypothetical protein